ncbi:TNF receptor-associated factor 5-like isoform X1 [Haemaphysalis longicornis]
MAVPTKYAVKDVHGLPNGVLLSFEKNLKPELICCSCNAVTPKGLKDGNGHIFCQECVAVHTDKMNRFTCSFRGCQADIKDMTGNEKEWEMLKQMKAACPNDKACTFTGTLQDVLRHYKTCRCQGKVKCPLCDSLEDSRILADHIREKCPRRLMSCVFCNLDVDACNKLKHERCCRQRPGTCEHCKTDFKTFAELEDQHIPICPRAPVHCSFKTLGCTFYGARRAVTAHEASGEHTHLLVREVCLVKDENKRLQESLQKKEKQYEDRLKAVMDNVARIEGQMERLKQQNIQMNEKLKAQEQQLKAQGNKHAEDNNAVRKFMASTQEAVGFLKRELYLGPQQSVFEHVWKLYPYSDLKRSAIMPNNGLLSSGVLSVNKPGYSIELVAAMSRAGGALPSSPHLALKIRIHKGDYDDLLPWPFANKIRVVLVNQHEEAESRRFELDPSDAAHAAACLQKPAQDKLNPMFGYSQLIPIPLLENERKGFLYRNCVVLKISVLALD